MKKIKLEEKIVKGKENIKVLSLPGDRIIFKLIEVKPVNTSKIVHPETGKPFDQPDFDRWPLRGQIVYVGREVKDKLPDAKIGNYVFLESLQAASRIDINGEAYGMSRVSNVILVYEDN